jgi:hypothetical protein
METLSELIVEYRDENNIYCMEGSRGVERLCKLLGAIGYGKQGCIWHGHANLSSLIDFLEDNSDVIETVIEWIGDQDIQEWKENLESELPEKDS